MIAPQKIEFAPQSAHLATEFTREIIRMEYGNKPAHATPSQPVGAA